MMPRAARGHRERNTLRTSIRRKTVRTTDTTSYRKMGCGGSKEVMELKTQLVVSTPSERGRILHGPASDDKTAVVLTLTSKDGTNPPSLEARDAATGNVVLSV